MTYQPHQCEDLALKTPAFRACPDHALCTAGDACMGRCSQPVESEFVMSEALRTGEHPVAVLQRLKEHGYG